MTPHGITVQTASRIGGINLHIFPASSFRTLTRVRREVSSLAERWNWDAIHVVGIEGPGLPESESYDGGSMLWRVPLRLYKTRPATLSRARTLLYYGEWYARIYRRYHRRSLSVIQCNSLDALPVAVALKRATKARLVYNAYELETETHWLAGWRKRLAKRQERLLIGDVDGLIVVSDSIARWYREHYPRLAHVRVVRNIPVRPDMEPRAPEDFRERLGVRPDDTLFIYSGALVDWRGTDFLMDVFARVPSSNHILFMGEGPALDAVQRSAAVRSNVHYQPSVPHDQILSYTSAADIGTFFVESESLNARYCLPNKVFEYLLAGVPIMVRDYPEMSGLVDQYRCGWKVPGRVDDVVALISGLTAADIAHRRDGARAAQQMLSWQREQQEFLGLYEDVLAGR